jgi:HSP20 family molecular chaperone IbpA
MSTLTRRDSRGPFVEIIDWLESPWTMFRPVAANPIRVEDYVRDGTFVVRAELPGLDPAEDIEVRAAKGVLTISATRQEEAGDKHRTEFRYGAFSRSLALPEGANLDRVRASYDKGILEVVIGLKDTEAETEARRIPVTPTKHIKPT